jgi:glucose-1-phosphate cytidylyltransferase
MKCVILAGGRGTRISEESDIRPKPMIEIGGRPLLWHIMKIYDHHGIRDFVVCLGYKGYTIKEYFANYVLHATDVTIDIAGNRVAYHGGGQVEPWRVTLVDTGLETMTGGRLRRVRQHLEGEQDFCLTYGDGVGNVDVAAEVAFHRAQGRLATMTVVQPPARFGAVALEGDRIMRFQEKPAGEGMINGGFFVLSPKVIDLIEGDSTIFEREPLARLAADGQLVAWKHSGYWQPMDTLREKNELEAEWGTAKPRWKVWG